MSSVGISLGEDGAAFKAVLVLGPGVGHPVVASALRVTEHVLAKGASSEPPEGSGGTEASPLHKGAGASLKVSGGAGSADEDGNSSNSDGSETEAKSAPATLGFEKLLLSEQVLVGTTGDDFIGSFGGSSGGLGIHCIQWVNRPERGNSMSAHD